MKKIFLILLVGIFSFAYELKLNSNLNTLKFSNERLLIGLDNGEIIDFSIKNKQIKLLTKLAKIKNFYEENVNARIYSIDCLNDLVLILSEGDFGSKNISIYNNKQLSSFKLQNDGVKKALFLDKNTILLALLGSSIQILDLKNKKIIKDFTFSDSSLSDVVLDESKNVLVAGFESGEIISFDLKRWQIIKKYKNTHKDNIYQLDFKNKTIISCGTDRKLGIIKNDDEKNIQRDFLIYTCALNSNANKAIFADNEKNTIELIDINTLKTLKTFQNKDFLLEYLVFLNDHEFISAGYENTIIFWSIDESF
ncbi:TPA: WD40 repeat domain-containing protein [Campylobacter lari]|nr:WD40 repeat domain-containing protein [Campylobacter lari]